MNCFLYLGKELFYYLIVTSCIGLLLLAKEKKFYPILLIALLFSWRSFSKVLSTRYYSFFILVAIFLSAYAIKYLSDFLSNQKKSIYYLTCALLIAAMLFVHLIKCFSSFNNIYIFDLQETFNRIHSASPDNLIFISEKESNRVSGNTRIDDKKETDMRLKEWGDDLTDFYLRNSYFDSKVFFFVAEKTSSHQDKDEGIHAHTSPDLYRKIGQHFSNERRDRLVSVYEHYRYTPAPTNVDLSKVLDHGILKAYIPEYDAYVYQDGNKLVWLIGGELDSNTEIVYYLDTDYPDLLPENRRKYKNDNRGFFAGSKWEREPIGKYRVFERLIPDEYPVKSIKCGFFIKDVMALYTRHFRVSK